MRLRDTDRVMVSRMELTVLCALLWQGQMNLHDLNPDRPDDFSNFYTTERKNNVCAALAYLEPQLSSQNLNDREELSTWYEMSPRRQLFWDDVQAKLRAGREKANPSVTFSMKRARFIFACLRDLLSLMPEPLAKSLDSVRLMQDLVTAYRFTFEQAGPLQDLTLARRIEIMYQHPINKHLTLAQIKQEFATLTP